MNDTTQYTDEQKQAVEEAAKNGFRSWATDQNKYEMEIKMDYEKKIEKLEADVSKLQEILEMNQKWILELRNLDSDLLTRALAAEAVSGIFLPIIVSGSSKLKGLSIELIESAFAQSKKFNHTNKHLKRQLNDILERIQNPQRKPDLKIVPGGDAEKESL